MIKKISLRDQVREYLLQEMAGGKIIPDSPISLAETARNLDVSVTPIREALNQLERAGIVTMVPNKGFILSALSLQEALELYPIISQLESLAIESSIYSEQDIEKLIRKNEKFMNAKNKKEAVLTDDQLHQLLIQNSNNKTLQRIISDLKIRILFYELEYQNDPDLSGKSGKEHDKIIRLLKGNKIEEGAALLKEHWIRSLIFIQNKMNSSVE